MKKRYIKLVRAAYRTLRHPMLRHRPWWRRLTDPLFDRALWIPCRQSVATGLACGFFFSMIYAIPQSLFAAIFATKLRGNIPFAVAACFVSNVFTAVPLAVAQIALGKWLIQVLHFSIPDFMTDISVTLPQVGVVSLPAFIVGFMGMGIICAALSYPIVHLFSMLLPHHLPKNKHKKKHPLALVK